jgi:hypothetical protein
MAPFFMSPILWEIAPTVTRPVLQAVNQRQSFRASLATWFSGWASRPVGDRLTE